MPENEASARRLRILVSIATFLYNEGRGLFISGTGEDIHGNPVDNVVSEIETIPAEIDGFRWANAAARFIRYLVSVLEIALQEEHEESITAAAADLGNFLEESGEI